MSIELPYQVQRPSLDGIPIRVIGVVSEAPDQPAVCLHGLGASSLSWVPFLAAAAGKLDCQALDFPGFGGSEPLRDYRQESLARRVARWIEVSNRGAVHLFGNSLGGAVAVRVAAKYPELVRSLTLISPAMPIRVPNYQHRRMLAMMVPGVSRMLAGAAAQASAEGLISASIQRLLVDPSCVPPYLVAEMVAELEQWRTKPWALQAFTRTLRGLASSYVATGRNNLWRMAAGVDAPTQIVAGTHDPLVALKLCQRLASRMPNARLLVLDNVAHGAQLEQPSAVLSAALSLMDGAVNEPRSLATIQ